jgi:hypothetical protein
VSFSTLITLSLFSPFYLQAVAAPEVTKLTSLSLSCKKDIFFARLLTKVKFTPSSAVKMAPSTLIMTRLT